MTTGTARNVADATHELDEIRAHRENPCTRACLYTIASTVMDYAIEDRDASTLEVVGRSIDDHKRFAILCGFDPTAWDEIRGDEEVTSKLIEVVELMRDYEGV